jgi:molybdopterin/thiamine biosynthesis adenylyltransferase
MESYLHISPKIWQEFRQSLLKARKTNEEVIGFLLCERHLISKNKMRYLPRVWVAPSPDCYEHQSHDGLILKQSFHLYLLKTYLWTQDYHVVHIHTHADQETPNFSDIDDRYESEYAQFLTTYCPRKPRFISGVFDCFLQQGKFRLWDRKGESSQPLIFSNSYFCLPSLPHEDGINSLMFSRQQVFGQGFQQQLGQLTISLIGCGGIGAILAELLGRLGVKNWVLIDPDRLETVNLNRLPSATQKMVEQQWYKVDYVKGLIKKIYATGSRVKALPVAVEVTSIAKEIALSDLIVVATDNHYSRQIAQELAIAYKRPLICLGTHIEIQADNTPRMYCRITIPPLDGGWCLMCGNIINLQQAALEIAPKNLQTLASQAGYLEGIEAPAVSWLNSICASTGVGIIQGMMTGFMNIEDGLDWIYDFPASNWLKTDVSYLKTTDCYFCGDSAPLEH